MGFKKKNHTYSKSATIAMLNKELNDKIPYMCNVCSSCKTTTQFNFAIRWAIEITAGIYERLGIQSNENDLYKLFKSYDKTNIKKVGYVK